MSIMYYSCSQTLLKALLSSHSLSDTKNIFWQNLYFDWTMTVDGKNYSSIAKGPSKKIGERNGYTNMYNIKKNCWNFNFSKVNNSWYNYHISVHDMTLYSHQLLSQNYFVKTYYIIIFLIIRTLHPAWMNWTSMSC